jgi:hypothetical protein
VNTRYLSRSKFSPSELRGSYDGNESMMSGGAGTKSNTQVTDRKIPTPDWFANDSMRREFLQKRFSWADQYFECPCERCCSPGAPFPLSSFTCNCRPCRNAVQRGRWEIVIRLWFLGFENDSTIEENYGWKKGTVGSIVQKIRRAVRDERLDGKPRTGRPRGRPKRVIPDNAIPDNEMAKSGDIVECTAVS